MSTAFIDLKDNDFSKKDPEVQRKRRVEESAARLQDIIRGNGSNDNIIESNMPNTAGSNGDIYESNMPNLANSNDNTYESGMLNPADNPYNNTAAVAFDPDKIKGHGIPEDNNGPITASTNGNQAGGDESLFDFLSSEGETGEGAPVNGAGDGPNGNQPELSNEEFAWDDNISATENWQKYLEHQNNQILARKADKEKIAKIQAVSGAFSMFGDAAAMALGGRVNPDDHSQLNRIFAEIDALDNASLNTLYQGYQQIFNQALKGEQAQAAQEEWNRQQAERNKEWDRRTGIQNREYDRRQQNKPVDTGDYYMQVNAGGRSVGLDEGQAGRLYQEAQAAFKNDPAFQKYLKEQNLDLKSMMIQFENQPIQARKDYIQAYYSYMAKKQAEQRNSNPDYGTGKMLERPDNMIYDEEGNLIKPTNPNKSNNSEVSSGSQPGPTSSPGPEQNIMGTGNGYFTSNEEAVRSANWLKEAVKSSKDKQGVLNKIKEAMPEPSPQRSAIINALEQWEKSGSIVYGGAEESKDINDVLRRQIESKSINDNDKAELLQQINEGEREQKTQLLQDDPNYRKQVEGRVNTFNEAKSADHLLNSGIPSDIVGMLRKGTGRKTKSELRNRIRNDENLFNQLYSKLPKEVQRDLNELKSRAKVQSTFKNTAVDKIVMQLIDEYSTLK